MQPYHPVCNFAVRQYWPCAQDGDKKQLGLFFFVESDAKALVDKVLQARKHSLQVMLQLL